MSSCTQIKAHVVDQALQLYNLPRLASGSVKALEICCDFCAKWEGCGKTAVFYREGGDVYHVPVAAGVATVPHEVLAEEGFFYFGIMGVDDIIRTTEVIRVEVVQGAITAATADSVEPTPDIYQQLLAAYGELDSELLLQRGRLNEVIAMRSTEGSVTYEYNDPEGSEPRVTGTIKTNGAMVELALQFMNLTIAAQGYYYWYNLPDGFAPMAPTEISTDQNLVITVENDASVGGGPRITLYNHDPIAATKPTIPIHVVGTYPLADLSVSELADIRVGHDGTVYPTAGEAVRGQIAGVLNGVPQLEVIEDGDQVKMRKVFTVEDFAGTCPELRIEAPFDSTSETLNNTHGKDTSLIKLVSYTAPYNISQAGGVGGTPRTLIWGRDVSNTMASALFANKTDSPNSYLGTSANPWGTVVATQGVVQTSARDAKENIKPVISEATPMTMARGAAPAVEVSDITIETILDFVRTLQPVTFNYKTDGEEVPQEAVQLGLIADDVAEHPVYKYVGIGGEALGLQALPLVTAALATCQRLMLELDDVKERLAALEEA